MRPRHLPLTVALIIALTTFAATASEPGAESGKDKMRPVPIFDELSEKADVIYLLASSSVVFGPDPNARSEEITFTGLVTIPKWPMPGYERRLLPNGRQQIDIELVESQLIGHSYLLGGSVNLGEHPDLRSLGTITEPGPSQIQAMASPALWNNAAEPHSSLLAAAYNFTPQEQTRRRVQQARPQERSSAEDRQFTYVLTENLERLMEKNPNVLWDELIAVELRALLEQGQRLQSQEVKPTIEPPPTAPQVERAIELSPDLTEAMQRYPDVNWQGWIYESAERLAADLLDNNVIRVDGDQFNPALIPNDFVVARKVLITTAKGILYNETPVPVKGSLTAIPPIKSPDTPLNINVFRGMELPVPLLDEEGSVDGWFYSKTHMAFAVVPDSIQKNQLKGAVTLRSGDETERVDIEGPAEIHHRFDGEGREMEFIVLALRGQSELLGGDIMIVEAFSDRDNFSKGPLRQKDGKTATEFDLFMEIYTPSAKLTNEEGITLRGSFAGLSPDGEISKGNLAIPVIKAIGDSRFSSTGGGSLFDEAGRLSADIVSLELQIVSEE